MTEKELIKACVQQDRKAQKLLYERYKDRLYMLSLKYCRNTSEAEDNLHDTFITIFGKIDTYRGKGSFEGWMKRIATFKAVDKYKKSLSVSRDDNTHFLEGAVEDANISEVPLDIILSAIQQLPNRYRLVFNLYELDGYSHKDIARMLSISENTSKSNLHRAKALLRDKLNGHKN